MNKLEAIILDWAGTSIDYGCFAPIKGFIEGFRAVGVDIDEKTARTPMGLGKLEHVRAIAATLPTALTEAQILTAYEEFEKVVFAEVENHCDLKDHVLDVVAELRRRGLKIGSTTGYTSEMMGRVIPKVRAQGYEPDFWVAPDQAGKGRPYPYMIWQNLVHLGVKSARNVVKVGDTIADVEEGINAQCWTVGVIMGSSELGLSRQMVEGMSHFELAERKAVVKAAFMAAGADYIADDLDELPSILDEIESRMNVPGEWMEENEEDGFMAKMRELLFGAADIDEAHEDALMRRMMTDLLSVFADEEDNVISVNELMDSDTTDV